MEKPVKGGFNSLRPAAHSEEKSPAFFNKVKKIKHTDSVSAVSMNYRLFKKKKKTLKIQLVFFT